mgnify:FL=1
MGVLIMNYVTRFYFFQAIDLFSGLFYVLGLLLVIVEMFYPGFGVPGIAGLILLIVAVTLTAKTWLDVLIIVLVLAAILSLVFTIIVKTFYKRKGNLSNKLVLGDSLNKESGYISNSDYSFLLDKEGVCFSPLRPVGSALIDGKRYDVITKNEFLQKGDRIKVVEVKGTSIFVTKVYD